MNGQEPVWKDCGRRVFGWRVESRSLGIGLGRVGGLAFRARVPRRLEDAAVLGPAQAKESTRGASSSLRARQPGGFGRGGGLVDWDGVSVGVGAGAAAGPGSGRG